MVVGAQLHMHLNCGQWGSGGWEGLLRLSIHLSCFQGSSGGWGDLFHTYLCINLNCVQRQIHVYDVLGSLAFIMLYARWPFTGQWAKNLTPPNVLEICFQAVIPSSRFQVEFIYSDPVIRRLARRHWFNQRTEISIEHQPLLTINMSIRSSTLTYVSPPTSITSCIFFFPMAKYHVEFPHFCESLKTCLSTLFCTRFFEIKLTRLTYVPG